jgi:hypothetical protein
MSIAKETAIAVPALAVLLFVSHIFFGPDESYREFAPGPRSWLGVAIPDGRFIAKGLITGRASTADADPDLQSQEQRRPSDLTPEARIKDVFAQFMPAGRRPATS